MWCDCDDRTKVVGGERAEMEIELVLDRRHILQLKAHTPIPQTSLTPHVGPFTGSVCILGPRRYRSVVSFLGEEKAKRRRGEERIPRCVTAYDHGRIWASETFWWSEKLARQNVEAI